MTQLSFRLPSDQAELSAAIAQFIAAEFNQQVTFNTEVANNDEPDKDGSWAELAWQVVVVATLEGSMQFAERVKRMARVKALLAVIKAKGQAVYLKIGNKQAVDLTSKSVDETMDLLANVPDDENNNRKD